MRVWSVRRVSLINLVARVTMAIVLSLLLSLVLAQHNLSQYLYGHGDQPDLRVDEPEAPHRLGRRTYCPEKRDPIARGRPFFIGSGALASMKNCYEDGIPEFDLRRAEGWQTRYRLWQDAITLLSEETTGALLHGRQDVLTYREIIERWAPRELEVLVAAAIAHQASDAKDRPFGTDLIEEVWLAYVDENASVGIAQIRPREVAYWQRDLVGQDLLSPEVAVKGMTAKIAAANRYLDAEYGEISETDRCMLLALVQNTTSEEQLRSTIDYFFVDADQDWLRMLRSRRAAEADWQEQLRLVLLHLDWLTAQGWQSPPALDRDYWRRIAFAD